MQNSLEVDSFVCLRSLRQLFENTETSSEQIADYDKNLKDFQELIWTEAAISSVVTGGYAEIDSTVQGLLTTYSLSTKYLNNSAANLTPDTQISLIQDLRSASLDMDEDNPSEPEHLIVLLETATASLNSKFEFRTKDSPENEFQPQEKIKYPLSNKIQEELNKLFSETFEKIAQAEANPVEIAGQLYAQFLAISPFSSENELMAHLLASNVLHSAGYFPIVLTSEDLPAFQSAVSKAMTDDHAPLTELLTQNQIKTFLRAIKISQSVLENERNSEILHAYLNLPQEVREAEVEDMEKTKRNVDRLWQISIEQFQKAAEEYSSQNLDGSPEFAFVDFASDNDTDRKHWYLFQVIRAASSFKYWAAPESFHYWGKLGYTTNSARHEIFLSFHAVGKKFNGLAAATLCSYKREVGAKRIVDFHTICDKPFIINSEQNFEDLEDNFSKWLQKGQEEGLVRAKITSD